MNVEGVEDVEDVDETIIADSQTEVKEGLWRLEVPMAEEQEVGPRGPNPVITFGERAREAIQVRDQAIVRMKGECIARHLEMEAADRARIAARAYLSPFPSEGSDSGSDSDSDTESEANGI